MNNDNPKQAESPDSLRHEGQSIIDFIVKRMQTNGYGWIAKETAHKLVRFIQSELIVDAVFTPPDEDALQAGFEKIIGNLLVKWNKERDQYIEQVTECRTKSLPFSGQLSHATVLAICAKELQSALATIKENK